MFALLPQKIVELTHPLAYIPPLGLRPLSSTPAPCPRSHFHPRDLTESPHTRSSLTLGATLDSAGHKAVVLATPFHESGSPWCGVPYRSNVLCRGRAGERNHPL